MAILDGACATPLASESAWDPLRNQFVTALRSWVGLVALPVAFAEGVVMQNTLVLPDRGANVCVAHASHMEMDALRSGDFWVFEGWKFLSCC